MTTAATITSVDGIDVTAECRESVAFSLLDDVVRTIKVSEADADFLRARYIKMYELFASNRAQEQLLNKRCKSTMNEILAEKILLEQTRIEEAQEASQLRRFEETRNSLQKEMEFTEQRETMAKFELTELKRVHEELTVALASMRKENNDLVGPVMSRLRTEISNYTEEIRQADEAFSKESIQKQKLLETVAELEKVKEDKIALIETKSEHLLLAENEPKRLVRQAEAIDKAVLTLEAELRALNRKSRNFEIEIEKQVKRRTEAEKLKKTLLEKLSIKRLTIEQREQDVALVRSNLEIVKARNHDLVTGKIELNVQKKDSESSVRHKIDQFGLAKKEYDNLKRQLKKKRVIANGVKQLLPTLESQLRDEELLLETYQNDRDRKSKDLQKLKDEVDGLVAQFLQQEGIERDKKDELQRAIADLDELEAEVVHAMAESKRQGKLLQVLSAQRDIISRESARIEQKEKEGRQHVRIKELVILDLTKRCNEITNRLKEFSALYEVVKNERNKYVNLIQSSTQALAEMREKIRILSNEVEILGNESSAKDVALAKEKSAHMQAQSQRDTLRQDMNRLLSEYRSKQGLVEQQIQEIDKLNIVINSLEKDMLDIKNKYERAVEERNVTGVQLIDRNDELCILYERSNQQQEAIRKGELELMKLDEEVRLVRLQSEELKRQYSAARKRLPEMDVNRSRITILEEQLVAARKRTDELSIQLEDPQNLDRWRPLEGEDPDLEQLTAKIKVLESRLDQKREHHLEKELILEEVSALIERLRGQAMNKRDDAKQLADNLNDLQHRIRETTKKMLASVSELSMYQATALRLQQEKSQREKALDEALWRSDHGEPPSEEAVKDWNRQERRRFMRQEATMRREEEMALVQPLGVTKTAAEPRPTAYIPDELGIPKPYGNLAPFKPTENGSTIRHIKMPNPKAIEI